MNHQHSKAARPIFPRSPREEFVGGDDRMAALAAEAARLVALGAEPAYRVEPDGGIESGFITMRDPEGNEFCLD